MLPAAEVTPSLVIRFAIGFGPGVGPDVGLLVGNPVGLEALSDRAQLIAMSYCSNISLSLTSPVADTTTVEAVSTKLPSSSSSLLPDVVPTNVEAEELEVSVAKGVSPQGTQT